MASLVRIAPSDVGAVVLSVAARAFQTRRVSQQCTDIASQGPPSLSRRDLTRRIDKKTPLMADGLIHSGDASQ
jgi:hypothetical protein